MERAGNKLTNGVTTTKLWLTLGYLLELVQTLGEEQELTPVYPVDEKSVYDNCDDGRDYDRDLA